MSWDEYAEGWDEDEGARAYAQAAFDSLGQVCAGRAVSLDGARVIDFGAGTGLLTEKMAPRCASVLAIDSSPKMVEQLERKIERLKLGNVRATTERLERIGEEEDQQGRLDVVVCSSVCAFVDDYPAVVAALVRFLRPSGLFVQWDWECLPGEECEHGLTRQQIKDALQAAGLRDIRVDTAFEVNARGRVMRPLIGAGQTAER